tara:strand:+ start:784 stop:1161 length:378 start_codon:yes stop_codon:yes gene_type:complete
MLNRILQKKSLFFLFFLIGILVSCTQEEKETKAIIIVKDFQNNTISGASVRLHQEGQISDQGEYTDPSLDRTEQTDQSGRAQFTYDLEAILDVEVVKYSGNDTLQGKGIVRLLQGKTVSETIEVN